ncbi:hypothetical protein IMG5_020700 [Ichthyophthirius multifiliis]|uniref:Cation-transporting P-type ATPase C-terminal domain-containing protein n=1 Tax=Ichthyophthirius multifiliis TaxID=5932 RepID=G0QKQ2_ICHMU|nr:hypothetical protein IMG5_020700 [Ichthyophthirius multifiliis]EGR34206.1 hypothetical protein IMG5_020700 [Ichthyophthirius multifiliis]|eukprot:XP_004039510.1 hypothetical protein IMG5_020700 [Ichthyophthirius multifiliis]
MLFPCKHKEFSFQKDSTIFVFTLTFLAFFMLFLTLPTFMDNYRKNYINLTEIIIRSLDIIAICIPPALPTCLSFGISFSLKRLNEKKIFCSNIHKISVCGKIKTLCLDKTGLTQNKLRLRNLVLFQDQKFQVQDDFNKVPVIFQALIASCHNILKVENNRLIGDNLDLEMFRFSGAQMINEGLIKLNNNEKTQIQILERTPFLSQKQKMYAKVQINENQYIFQKGSPEKILESYQKSPFIQIFNEKFQELVKQGHRVLSFSYKIINKIQENNNNYVYENNNINNSYIFGGFLIFENSLKKNTLKNIQELNQSNIKLLMLTGDNPLSSLKLAFQTQILNTDQAFILDFQIKNQQTLLNGQQVNIQDQELIKTFEQKPLVITGSFFYEYMSSKRDIQTRNNQYLVQTILKNAIIYARFTPDQKQYLISLLQNQDQANYTFIGMIGDPSTNSGALKEADMGVSLINKVDESGSLCPQATFTSSQQDIQCLYQILKEGRACLVTSFECFKYMALYSMIESYSLILLYFNTSMPTDNQFLFWDLFIIFPLTFILGLTEGAPKLTKNVPTGNLISHEIIISVIGQGIIQLSFQLWVLFQLERENWYISGVNIYEKQGIQELYDVSSCYEATSLFWISNLQYIFVVVSFSIGSVHKKPFYSNIYYCLTVAFLSLVSFILIFSKIEIIRDFFKLKYQVEDELGNVISEMPDDWRNFVGFLTVLNGIVTLFYERKVLPFLVRFSRKYSKWYMFIFRKIKKHQDIDDYIQQY